MRKALGILALSLLLLACQNKSRQEYSPTLTETQSEESYLQADTIGAYPQPLPEEGERGVRSETEDSHESSDYDNMRGFDPASEDDMEDNGMSRYMENNDDQGWD